MAYLCSRQRYRDQTPARSGGWWRRGCAGAALLCGAAAVAVGCESEERARVDVSAHVAAILADPSLLARAGREGAALAEAASATAAAEPSPSALALARAGEGAGSGGDAASGAGAGTAGADAGAEGGDVAAATAGVADDAVAAAVAEGADGPDARAGVEAGRGDDAAAAADVAVATAPTPAPAPTPPVIAKPEPAAKPEPTAAKEPAIQRAPKAAASPPAKPTPKPAKPQEAKPTRPNRAEVAEAEVKPDPRVAAVDPGLDATDLYWKGKRELEAGKLNEAIVDLTASLQRRPSDRTRTLLGRAYFDAGKLAEAEKVLKAAPRHADALLLLAALYQHRGRSELARRTYTSLLTYFPDHPRAAWVRDILRTL